MLCKALRRVGVIIGTVCKLVVLLKMPVARAQLYVYSTVVYK
jgi:hypothetical protein